MPRGKTLEILQKVPIGMVPNGTPFLQPFLLQEPLNLPLKISTKILNRKVFQYNIFLNL